MTTWREDKEIHHAEVQRLLGPNCKTNRKWPDDTFNFSCQQCGACCRNEYPIELSPLDLDRIMEVGSWNNIPFRWNGHDLMLLRPCSFLRGNCCAIYENRPFMCRSFPLTPFYHHDENGRVIHKSQFEMGNCKSPIPNMPQYTVQDWIRTVDPRGEYLRALVKWRNDQKPKTITQDFIEKWVDDFQR